MCKHLSLFVGNKLENAENLVFSSSSSSFFAIISFSLPSSCKQAWARFFPRSYSPPPLFHIKHPWIPLLFPVRKGGLRRKEAPPMQSDPISGKQKSHLPLVREKSGRVTTSLFARPQKFPISFCIVRTGRKKIG